VIAERSCELLTAANDQRWGADMAFGSPIPDEPAPVLVHAEAPRGAGCFEFAARPLATLASTKLPSTGRIH